MLTIRDLDGTDLTVVKPETIERSVVRGTVAVPISCVIAESDTNLPFQAVSAEVNWNDGTPPVHYPTTSPTATQTSPMTLSLSRNLGFGTYAVTVTGRNNRAIPDQLKVTFLVVVSPLQTVAEPPRYIYGPILPRDNGLPNRQTWLFDTASDLMILESSVRMLLLTVKGERLMQPDYGTNLRRIIFDPSVESVDALITQEITQALSLYEPRVVVQAVDVERDPNSRNVNVNALFLSRVSAQPFQVNLQLA